MLSLGITRAKFVVILGGLLALVFAACSGNSG
ncbi:MAG: hypothetical protein QOH71_4080, partial [Blastocatellia bacterium]|nr:hypothetical protein [Blastocatellia bacterium]